MKRLLVASSALAITAALTGQACAQEAMQLDEVIITAERREENLQRTAIAVTAVTGAAVEEAGVSRAEDLSRVAPAVQITSGGSSYTQIFLRGVGNFGVNAYAEQAVAFNYDGIYLSRPGGVNGMFYDLQRVEVLKGPQGTLYGRNATGGAINVLPNKPTFNYEGGLGLDLGSFDLIKADAFINLPLVSDKVALRVAAQTNSRDGYYSDGLGDDDSQGVRAQLRVEPSDSLSANLSADYFHQGGRGAGATVFSGTSEPNWDGLHSPRVIAAYAATVTPPTFRGLPEVGLSPTSNETFREYTDSTFWGAHAAIDWRTSLGTLTVIPAYRKADQDFVGTNSGFNMDVLEQDEQTSLEARFASEADQRLRYVLGGFWFKEDIATDQYYNQVFNATDQVIDLNTETWALFGQATFAVTDTFRLVGGARYTQEDKSQKGVSYTVLVPPFGTFLGRSAPSPMGGSDSWESTTWKAGVEWDVAPASLLYANVATGFKAGGFYPAPTQFISSFEPEHLTAYTVGSKNRFLDGRLQLNAEAFYWRYEDQQVSHLIQLPDGSITLGTDNVGKSTIYGVEAEAQYLLTENTLLAGSMQYNHAEYDEFVYDIVNFGGPSDVAARYGCPFTGPVGGVRYTVNCSGYQVPQAPEWTLSAGIRQTFPLESGAKIVADLRTLYRSERFLTFDFTPALSQDADHRTDFSLTYAAPEDRWSVTAYVNNIEDAVVKQSGFINPQRILTLGMLEPPRTFGLRLRAKFGGPE